MELGAGNINFLVNDTSTNKHIPLLQARVPLLLCNVTKDQHFFRVDAIDEINSACPPSKASQPTRDVRLLYRMAAGNDKTSVRQEATKVKHLPLRKKPPQKQGKPPNLVRIQPTVLKRLKGTEPGATSFASHIFVRLETATTRHEGEPRAT